MRTVGANERSEIETDPTRAWRRGIALDALLRNALPPHPRGVWRLTHAQMNQLDFERQRQQAVRVNRR